MVLDKTLQEFVAGYSRDKGIDTSQIVPEQQVPTMETDPISKVLPLLSGMTEGEFLSFIVDLIGQYNVGNREQMLSEQMPMGQEIMMEEPMMQESPLPLDPNQDPMLQDLAMSSDMAVQNAEALMSQPM